MNNILEIIKGVVTLGIVVFLYAFSSIRNNVQPIHKIKIDFIGENALYISKSSVDKLLIQNQEPLECISKEVLDLKELESKLESHQMIQKAEAYLTVNGEVRLELEQRQPVARVISEPSFYIDSYGKKMPLSDAHSARVLLVYGALDGDKLDTVFELIQAVRKDEFLSSNVSSISIDSSSRLSMQLRGCLFDVELGNLEQLSQKLTNLKAFYQKAKKDNILQDYKTINLKFNRQVVCTKK